MTITRALLELMQPCWEIWETSYRTADYEGHDTTEESHFCQPDTDEPVHTGDPQHVETEIHTNNAISLETGEETKEPSSATTPKHVSVTPIWRIKFKSEGPRKPKQELTLKKIYFS